MAIPMYIFLSDIDTKDRYVIVSTSWNVLNDRDYCKQQSIYVWRDDMLNYLLIILFRQNTDRFQFKV